VHCVSTRNDDLYDDDRHGYYSRDADDYSSSNRRYRDEDSPQASRREHRYTDSGYSDRPKEASVSPAGRVNCTVCINAVMKKIYSGLLDILKYIKCQLQHMYLKPVILLEFTFSFPQHM